MANPPLDIFGKLSGIHCNSISTSGTTTTANTTAAAQLPNRSTTSAQLMDQINAAMQQRLDQLQASISTTLTTAVSRNPHYGPATEEERERCRWCKRTNHTSNTCFFRPVEQGGRGRGNCFHGGRGGFNSNRDGFGGGRGRGNGRFNDYSNKRSFDALSDSDLQSIADRVVNRIQGDAQRAKQKEVVAKKARQALDLTDEE